MFSNNFPSLFYLFSLIFGSLFLADSYRLQIHSNIESNFIPHQTLIVNVNSTLELTCQVVDISDESNVSLTWHLPERIEEPLYKKLIDYNNGSLTLILNKLKERDGGQYVCEANIDRNNINATVDVYFKRQPSCMNQFDCLTNSRPPICIHHRFVCDGVKDCDNGLDESSPICGADPCYDKIICMGGRCIPKIWCCNPWEPNCTARVRHPCCQSIQEHEYIYNQNSQHYSEMTFLQSTIYTIVGFAMVFMSIVTILMIAICRIHLQRSLISSVPRRQGSIPTSLSRTPRLSSSSQRRAPDRRSITSNRMLVSYNIPNNGLEIVGDPCQPPPYSEVTPYSDPPPSYIEIFNNRTDEENETSPCLSSEKPLP